MVEKTKYRLWLKLRIGKSLDTEDDALTVSIAGRTVTIESEKRGEPLSKTSWLVMSCRGFETEAQARKFGGGSLSSFSPSRVRSDPGRSKAANHGGMRNIEESGFAALLVFRMLHPPP